MAKKEIIVVDQEPLANCERFESLKHSSFCPYAFTEHGVVMLSSVLHSDEAIEISGRVEGKGIVSATIHYYQRKSHKFDNFRWI